MGNRQPSQAEQDHQQTQQKLAKFIERMEELQHQTNISRLKILLIGPENSGKTSLYYRYLDGIFYKNKEQLAAAAGANNINPNLNRSAADNNMINDANNSNDAEKSQRGIHYT